MKTKHGCTCKTDWLTIDGKKEGGCVYGSEALSGKCGLSRDKLPNNCSGELSHSKIQWCVVEDNCGYKDLFSYSDKEWNKIQKGNKIKSNTGKFWDYCHWDENPEEKPIVKSKWKHIGGLVVYLIMIGILSPIFLNYIGLHSLIEVWIPNLDLIATSVSYRSGFFGTGLFSLLYNMNPKTNIGKWSKLVINYFSLVGLLTITGKQIKDSKKISTGLAYGLVMILLTYLLPNEYIHKLQEYLYQSLEKYNIRNIQRTDISIIGGLLFIIVLLVIERLFLYRAQPYLEAIATYFLKIIKIKNI